jgi:hypothetical protein
LVYPSSDFIVLNELAAISGGDSFFNFANEPLVVVHHPLHGLHDKCLGVAALLRR